MNPKVLYNLLLSIRGLLDGALIMIEESLPPETPAKGHEGPVRKVQDASGTPSSVQTLGGKKYPLTLPEG